MKKIIIVLLSFILIISSLNFAVSKSVSPNDLIQESENSIKSSIFNKAEDSQIMNNINGLNGYFTENRGQAGNESVRYYIHGKGVWFLDNGVVFELRKEIEAPDRDSGFGVRDSRLVTNPRDVIDVPVPIEYERVILKQEFECANSVIPEGRGQLSHKSNFFYGNDSSKWCANVPNYQEVIYENIYENIDLKYYNTNKGLKYDFIVHHGGNPSDIRMRYEGVQDLYVDPIGNLVLHTSLGDVVDSGLFIYQNTANGETEINGKFKKLSPGTYGFEILGQYDNTRDLVIDPLVYSTYIGGNDFDYGYGLQIDSSGNAYVTGQTESLYFPTTAGVYDITFNGYQDVFVLKLDPTGSTLLYSTFIGGKDYDAGYGLQIDSSGNVYVGGRTLSSNFPTTAGAYDITHNGWWDVIVLKLNPTGSALLYSTFIGGSEFDRGYEIQIDSSGNAYVTGPNNSSNFPTTAGAYDMTYNGGRDDVFVLKLNPTGSALVYSTFIGGNDYDDSKSIQIDSSGNAYVTGLTLSSNFPTTAGAYDMTFNGGGDVFVVKLNPTGSALVYSTFIGGSIWDCSRALQIDSSGNAYVTGDVYSSNFPTTAGAYDITYNGALDVFVLKLNPTGSALVYSTYIGGSGVDVGYGIQIDSSGNAYVTGNTASTGFPTTVGAYDTTFNGADDAFVLKLNPSGTALVYSTFIGGSEFDCGSFIQLDSGGNIYVSGGTWSNNFPTSPGAYDRTHNGQADVFVLKLTFKDLPYVVDLKISEPTVLRTNSVYLYSNVTDTEDPEQDLTPHFEYRDPNEQVWNSTYYSSPYYNNSRWEISFTPPKNAPLGLYDFRVRFNNSNLLYSDWCNLNDSLTVLNNLPTLNDLILSKNLAILYDVVTIWIDGSDIEDPEKDLIVSLEYRDPTEQSWDITYLDDPKYVNNKWEYTFSIPFDALFGYYDFKARFEDKDNGYSQWFFKNDSLLVSNLRPEVVDISVSKSPIYRTTSTNLYVNGIDYETPESMLKFYAQSKPQNGGEWTDLTGVYSDSNNNWEAELVTTIDSILGFYDFRVKFEDSESASSGWVYLNASLKVLNNPPLIIGNLDNIEVSITPKLIDLTPYESDIEDEDINLIWNVDETRNYDYLESVKIIDTVNDILEIVPKENVIGQEDIELTLTDKDGDIDVKSDITILINSTKIDPEDIPDDDILKYKVNLTAEKNYIVIKQGDLTEVNLTLKNEGNVEDIYKISFSSDKLQSQINIDKTDIQLAPDLSSILKLDIIIPEDFELGIYSILVTATSISNETIKDDEIIEVEVVGKDFIPKYKVEITVNPDSIEVYQNDSDNTTLTITNKGNILDDYAISFESDNFTDEEIQLFKNILSLNAGDDSQIKVVITIPEYMKPGEYKIKFIVRSNMASDDSELTIYVKEKSKEVEPDEVKGKEESKLSINIGIIIIIIIVILILILLTIFMFRKRQQKRPREEEILPQELIEMPMGQPDQQLPNEPETTLKIPLAIPLNQSEQKLNVSKPESGEPPKAKPVNPPEIQTNLDLAHQIPRAIPVEHAQK